MKNRNIFKLGLCLILTLNSLTFVLAEDKKVENSPYKSIYLDSNSNPKDHLSISKSQTSEVNNNIWRKNFGGSDSDVFNSIAQTPDGGYIAVGYTYSNDFDIEGLYRGGGDAIIVKYDSKGEVEYKKIFGGKGAEWFNSVSVTEDGGYIVAGDSNSKDQDLNGLNKGGTDSILVKYNHLGDVQWNKNFGGNGYDSYNYAINSSDGGYIVVGQSDSSDGDLLNSSKGWRDAIIVKYDNLGNIEWCKSYGGSSNDMFQSLCPTIDGGFLAIGFSASNNGDLKGLSIGGGDGIIVKYDHNGNISWKKSFGGSQYDEYKFIKQSDDDGYVVLGKSNSNDGDLIELHNGTTSYSDGILIKYDNSGNVVWKKNFGGSKNESFNSLQKTVDGGFIAVGYSYSNDGDLIELHNGTTSCSDGILVKYDSSGNVIWKKNFGGSKNESFNSVQQTIDGGFITVGDSYSTDGDLIEMHHGNTSVKDSVVLKLLDNTSDDIIKIINKTIPETYTNDSVENIINVNSPYGVTWIKNNSENFKYGDDSIYSYEKNGTYTYTVCDSNLNKKTIITNINNIDTDIPTTPTINKKNNLLEILQNGDVISRIQTDITEDFEDNILNFSPILNGAWNLTSSQFQSGLNSYKSPTILYGENTSFEICVYIPEGNIGNNFDFSYKVDGKVDYDYFNLYVDYLLIKSDSGQKPWQNFSYSLYPGEHLIKFEYAKDSRGNTGTDSIYIDNLNIKTSGEVSVTASGIAKTEYSLDKGVTWKDYTHPVNLPIGTYEVQARSIDKAGNISDISKENITIDGIPSTLYSDINVSFDLQNTLEVTMGSDINFGTISTTGGEIQNSNITVTSSLPYNVGVKGLSNFIGINDSTNNIPINKLTLNIDGAGESPLSLVENTLVTNSISGINKNHNLSFKLDSTLGYGADTYNTQIELIVSNL